MNKKIFFVISAIICLLIAVIVIAPAYFITPQSIDTLLRTNLSEDWEPNDLIESEERIDVEETYISDNNGGYLSLSIFSYKDRDIWSKPYKKTDWKKQVRLLSSVKKIKINDNIWYVGTSSSDDMPDMVLCAFVKKGDYVFECRLNNFDEQVTDHQKKIFPEILESISLV